jgi:hypothetical protein
MLMRIGTAYLLLLLNYIPDLCLSDPPGLLLLVNVVSIRSNPNDIQNTILIVIDIVVLIILITVFSFSWDHTHEHVLIIFNSCSAHVFIRTEDDHPVTPETVTVLVRTSFMLA